MQKLTAEELERLKDLAEFKDLSGFSEKELEAFAEIGRILRDLRFMKKVLENENSDIIKELEDIKTKEDIKGFDFLYSIIKDQQNEIEYLGKRLSELEGFVRKDKVNTYAYGTGVDYGYMVK